MSKCEECPSSKSVCATCKDNGQVSQISSLRVCDACLGRNLMCQKLVVMAVATDCEECNKKALVCLSETSTTNGPQGTVSQKTQVSVSLLKKGMDRLYMNVNRRWSRIWGRHTAGNAADNTSLKPACCLTLQAWDIYGSPVCPGFWYNREGVYKAYIQMGSKVLYAWQVVLSCPSIGRAPFSCCNDGTFAKWRNNTRYGGTELMKEWLESYRPVHQRKVRSETTKDKAGALPPAVYAVQPTANESEERLRFPEEIE